MEWKMVCLAHVVEISAYVTLSRKNVLHSPLSPQVLVILTGTWGGDVGNGGILEGLCGR